MSLCACVALRPALAQRFPDSLQTYRSELSHTLSTHTIYTDDYTWWGDRWWGDRLCNDRVIGYATYVTHTCARWKVTRRSCTQCVPVAILLFSKNYSSPNSPKLMARQRFRIDCFSSSLSVGYSTPLPHPHHGGVDMNMSIPSCTTLCPKATNYYFVTRVREKLMDIPTFQALVSVHFMRIFFWCVWLSPRQTHHPYLFDGVYPKHAQLVQISWSNIW